MADPKPTEVIPKVIVREAVPTTGRTATDEMAIKVAQILDEEGWRAGAEAAQQKHIEQRQIDERIEQIGVTRDPATGAKTRTGAELTRFNEAKNGAALAKKFIDSGYNGLNPGEQLQVRNDLLNRLRLIPAFATQIASLNLTQQQALAERYLKDPRFTGELRILFNDYLDPSKKLTDAVNLAQDALDEAKISRDDKEQQVNDVNSRVQNVDRQLSDYARPATGAIGAKARRIDDIKSRLPTLENELKTHQDSLTRLKENREELRRERRLTQTHGPDPTAGRRDIATLDTELTRVNADITAAENEVNTRQSQISEKQSLEQEEVDLNRRKQELEREKSTLTSEFKRIDIEYQHKLRSLSDEKALRTGQEQDLVDHIKGIFGETTLEIVNKEMEQAIKAMQAELDTLKQLSADQNEKALADYLGKRYITTRKGKRGLLGHRRNEIYHPLDKTTINADFDILMAQGPEALMKELLCGHVIFTGTRGSIYAGGSINPATGVRYTEAEAKTVLADSKFVEKMQPVAIQQLITNRVMSGGISKEDTFAIMRTTWGQGMIENAIKTKTEFRQLLEKMSGENALSKGFLGRVGDILSKHPELLLLLALPALVMALAGSGEEKISA